MKISKQFSPNAETAASVPTTKSTKTVNLIPTKDADLLALSNSVNSKWASTPALTLQWITQPTFESLFSSFRTNLNARTQIGGARKAQTQTLAQVNKEINLAVAEVKVYIEKKYKKANAAANFSKYGIALENKAYNLPKDNDKRLLALPLMQAAIIEDGFADEEYGSSFWSTTIANFKAALSATGITTKNISSKVAAKDVDIEKIKKVLNSIVKLIEANYPDTVKETLREWGFIKQNY
jgi:hypothetical protein